MTEQIKSPFIYFPLYLSDYVSEGRKLTMLQRGAYIDIACLYFQENLKLEYTKEQIYRMVFAFEKEEREAVDFILANYFTKSENKPTGLSWVSNQFNEIGSKVLKRLEASRNNGKKGGRGKKSENKPTGLNPLNLDESILNETKLNQIKLKEIKLIKQEYTILADGLIFILEAKMNKKLPAGSQKSYAEEIRKLIEIDLKVRAEPEEDVKRAIQAISDNYGKDYFPIIQSGGSFREKFVKIEDYLKRTQNSKKTELSDTYQNLMNKYRNEENNNSDLLG
jgi:uncharacterized protein YdaU (DUF1376 family)